MEFNQSTLIPIIHASEYDSVAEEFLAAYYPDALNEPQKVPILDIAKKLKIPVIAEGVENEEQLKLLKGLGCTIVQGYYFSRPLQALDFESSFIQNIQSD